MDLQTFFYVYVIIGIFFVTLEHRSYDWSMLDNMSPLMVALNILHQIIHYSRFMLVWPWYIVEDLLIILTNRIMGNSDE